MSVDPNARPDEVPATNDHTTPTPTEQTTNEARLVVAE